ncbi:MAG: hypothetical protein F6K04_15070, partial [Leptolyngbya sp. SIO4C5]|nr:hypothetical protein [Leptolyngbya sp. SIO4C5]
MIWGKLEKLKIKSYLADKRQEGGIFYALNKTYEVMFNPESYSFRYENEFQKYQGINTAGRTARYSLSRSRTLSLKFIIDDSSATAGLAAGGPSISLGKFSIRKTIHDRVEEFLDIAARMDGDIHAPRYLKLEWGDLIFDCRLQSVDVGYTLFNRSGTAIRAELDAVFLEDLNPEKLAKLTNKSSPDLTHTRTVTGGDTLPIMAHRIYRDPTYYMRVAQAK